MRTSLRNFVKRLTKDKVIPWISALISIILFPIALVTFFEARVEKSQPYFKKPVIVNNKPKAENVKGLDQSVEMTEGENKTLNNSPEVKNSENVSQRLKF